MAQYRMDEQNSLCYFYEAPTNPKGFTWVFYNALTGDAGMWEKEIAPCLRQSGHGTLSFNYRGQSDSPFSPDLELEPSLIVDDSRGLLEAVRPVRPILCGLSIGGLFAIQNWLSGLPGLEVAGMVLINTLRTNGTRLRWINDALVRCVELGGLELFRDLYVPLLFNQEWQDENREKFLNQDTYLPIPRGSGHYNLLRNAWQADWDQPYEDLHLPVLVITGLEDRVFLDLYEIEKLCNRLPMSQKIMIHNAGHMVPVERPTELVDSMRQFAEEMTQ